MIFEAAGVPALLAHATSQLSPAGRLVAMTFGKEPIPVNFKEINAKELTILGTVISTRSSPRWSRSCLTT